MKYCLHVSPNTLDRDIFLRAFRHMAPGDQCLVASSAQDAFRLMKNTKIVPDLVCVERDMTAVDGIELLRMFKRTETLRNVPVIVHATLLSETDVDELKASGALAILTRPHDFYSVCTMLALYFGFEPIAICSN